jgi:hypothetical protein
MTRPRQIVYAFRYLLNRAITPDFHKTNFELIDIPRGLRRNADRNSSNMGAQYERFTVSRIWHHGFTASKAIDYDGWQLGC